MTRVPKGLSTLVRLHQVSFIKDTLCYSNPIINLPSDKPPFKSAVERYALLASSLRYRRFQGTYIIKTSSYLFLPVISFVSCQSIILSELARRPNFRKQTVIGILRAPPSPMSMNQTSFGAFENMRNSHISRSGEICCIPTKFLTGSRCTFVLLLRHTHHRKDTGIAKLLPRTLLRHIVISYQTVIQRSQWHFCGMSVLPLSTDLYSYRTAKQWVKFLKLTY